MKTKNGAKINLKNAIALLQGNYRYFLFYNEHLRRFLRRHIKEQIAYRIYVMDPTCFSQGMCSFCGCPTTKLQMANKTCGGICYPVMMNRGDWENFLKTDQVKLWKYDLKK